MLRFISKWTPLFYRVLVVESGARSVTEHLLQELYARTELERLDVFTCYGTAPPYFDPLKGHIFETHRVQGVHARKKFLADLRSTRYSAICILCTGVSVMTKWKWMTAALVPAKILLVNENGDTFWLDRGHIRYVKGMIRERLRLNQISPLRVLQELLLFPFTLAILLAFAVKTHARRLLRTL
jgi:hypothetical protein